MKKICVITTGGTIDSTAAGNTLSVEGTASATLMGLLEEVMEGRAALEVLSPVNKNSEDFSLHDIEAIAAAIDRAAGEGHKRFLVTHGSDTLHFTAAVLGFLFARRGLTICLVAAFRPLFQAGSDGPDNLRAAVRWLLSEAPPATYVALKEDVDRAPVLIAHWRDVKPLSFDSRGMECLHGRHAARFTPEDGLSAGAAPLPFPTGPAVSHEGLAAGGRHVRLIDSYVGLDAEVLAALGATARVIVIAAYHSGTVPSHADPRRGVTSCVQAQPETLFLLARHPDRLEGYASVKRFEAAGGMVIRHLMPHQAYILACLLTAGGHDLPALRRAFEVFSQPTGDR